MAYKWAAESFLKTQPFVKYICYEYSSLLGSGSTHMDHPDLLSEHLQISGIDEQQNR